MKSYTNIDEYISNYPDDTQLKLKEIRKAIQKIAPEAKEKIAYGIPTFVYHGNLVHFGGFKDHIGFFPGASGVTAFENELRKYETSKGTIRFSLEKPLPLALIRRIVKFRIQENLSTTK
jgi:uncharacterized protein YdhG (YjbR/CyaY superfamily)